MFFTIEEVGHSIEDPFNLHILDPHWTGKEDELRIEASLNVRVVICVMICVMICVYIYAGRRLLSRAHDSRLTAHRSRLTTPPYTYPIRNSLHRFTVPPPHRPTASPFHHSTTPSPLQVLRGDVMERIPATDYINHPDMQINGITPRDYDPVQVRVGGRGRVGKTTNPHQAPRQPTANPPPPPCHPPPPTQFHDEWVQSATVGGV